MPTTKNLTLKHSILWTFLGFGVWSLGNWLMGSVIAKLGNPVMLGQFTLANVIGGPIFLFMGLQLRTYLVTDSSQRYRFGEYFSLRLLTSTIALLGISIFGFCMYQHTTAWVIAIAAGGMWFDSISDIVYGIFQEKNRADCVACSMGTKGVLNLLLLWAAMYVTHNIIWAEVGNSMASVCIVLLYDLPTGYSLLKKGNQHDGRITRSSIMSLMTFKRLPEMGKVTIATMPLGIILLFAATSANVPQYFVQKYMGERELGLYSAIAYLINVGRIGVLAAGNAASPYLARAYSALQYNTYRNIVLKLVLLGVLLSVAAPVVASLIGRKAVTVLYTAEYAHQSRLIVMILLAGGLRYLTMLIGACVTAAKTYNLQIAWFGFTLVIGVISCWWFVPRLGLEGAAIASGITAVVDIIIGVCVLMAVLSTLKKNRDLSLLSLSLPSAFEPASSV